MMFKKKKRRGPLIYIFAFLIIIIGVFAYFYPLIALPPPIDGIRCDRGEQLAYHIHVDLKLFDEGKEVTIPANIGVHPSCMYWIHTHDTTGKIHIESPEPRTFRLRDFFKIWGRSITAEEFLGKPVTPDKPLKITVNGEPYFGDPGDIELRDNMLIVIQYGRTPPTPT